MRKDSLQEYDVVILGGGTGGTVAAWTFASKGQRVAVIERKYVGGSCPNIACLPSKNVIHSAKVASYFRRSEEFGIPNRDFTVDMRAVRERKRRMVSHWNNLYLDNYKKSGAEFILGSGRFVDPKILEATLPDGTTRQLGGTNVIINTGTRDLKMTWTMTPPGLETYFRKIGRARQPGETPPAPFDPPRSAEDIQRETGFGDLQR